MNEYPRVYSSITPQNKPTEKKQSHFQVIKLLFLHKMEKLQMKRMSKKVINLIINIT